MNSVLVYQLWIALTNGDLLQAMDENGDGAISYDEWLSFFLKVNFFSILIQPNPSQSNPNRSKSI